jgi:hypothetical protein
MGKAAEEEHAYLQAGKQTGTGKETTRPTGNLTPRKSLKQSERLKLRHKNMGWQESQPLPMRSIILVSSL